MSQGRHRGFRLGVRLALWAHPRPRREADGPEIETAAVLAYGARRRQGGWKARILGARILLDLVRSGLEERARARREGGGMVTGLGTAWRDGWTDVRVAARSLWRTPGFVLASVAVLALGIGANTAVFSALRATLLLAPPYPEPERLVFLDLTDSSTVRAGPPRAFPWSYPKFKVLEDAASLPLESAAAYARRFLTLTGAGDAAYLAAEFVTPQYLSTLGVTPLHGRDFVPEDDGEGAPLVVLVGHGLWRERLGADPSVVGGDITLNDRMVRVVGVAPPGFRGLTGTADVWMTVSGGAALTAPFLVRGGRAHWLRVVARVSPGTDVALLDQRMREVGRAAEEAYPDTDPTVARAGSAESFAQAMVNPQARTSLLVLSAAAALLLLVACANLAGLLLARAGSRSREAAVRVALGAGRWRVARAFLVEALLLSGAGGVAGLLVAKAGVDALARLWPARFVDASWNVRATGVDAVGLDPWVVGFAAAVALTTGLLFGVAPALSAGQTNPAGRLRGGVGGAGRGGRRILDVRGALVAGEMGLALVLLVGASLLLRSLAELHQVDRGFEAGDLVSFEYAIPRTSRWAAEQATFHERYLERLRALPGVEEAALTCVPPLAGHCMITGVREAGGRTWSEGSRPSIGVHYVSDDYFRTLGVPVLQGRTFTSEDQSGTRAVVVLSQAAVRELFPDGAPLGKTVAMGTGLTSEERGPAEVIGVVGDILFDRPANGVMAEAFISHRQEEGGSTVLLRTRAEPLAVIPGARAALAEIDAAVPLFGVRTLEDLERGASGDTRVMGVLLAVFALLALLLACTGVWAVVAFAVAQRTREIGVRVALGADASKVVRIVLRQGVVLSLVGLGVGGGGAWAASRLLRSLLHGVEPADPVAFAASALVLLAVAMLASWLPARRATRVDPMVALRAE